VIGFLRYVVDPAYLYAMEPFAAWRWSGLLLASAAFCIAVAMGIAVGLRRHRQDIRWWGWVSVASWTAAGVHTLARPLLSGLASARVYAASCALLGTAVLVVGIAPRMPLFGTEGSPSRRLAGWLLLIALHALGMGVWYLKDGSTLAWWLALVVLMADAAVCATWPRARRGMPLGAPLAPVYVSVVLRWLVGTVLGFDVDACLAFTGADLVSPWFDGLAMGWAAMAGSLLLAGWRIFPDRSRRDRWLGCGILLAGLAIAFSVGWRHMAAGVTASDPFCYLQMAADLAEHGTVFHHFPLAAIIRGLDVPLWPTVHVGYHVPNTENAATTVWPLGWPLMLAPVYRIVGEGGALWGGLACLLGASGLTVVVGHWLLRDSRWGGWLAGGIAGFLLVTSQETLVWSLVPMADAAAALASIIMIGCLVRSRETGGTGWGVAAGVAYGAAYWIRHPLVFLGLGAMPICGVGRRDERVRWWQLLAFAGSAAAVAVPDLVYHARAFGAPWITESREWSLLSGVHLLSNLGAMVAQGFSLRGEFGYLWPLALLGLVATWRCGRMERGLWLMLVWSFAGALAFQLCYRALRWRDLSSLLPWLAIWTGAGMEELLQRLPKQRWRAFASALVLLLLSGRVRWVLSLPARDEVGVFGHLAQTEVAAYQRLGDRLPDDAVVATGLGSGAVERYAGHQTIRPASWDEQEFGLVLSALEAIGREVWLLDESDETRAVLERLPGGWEAEPGQIWDLPSFGTGGEPSDREVRLWRLIREIQRKDASP